jgi:hypothetical protein
MQEMEERVAGSLEGSRAGDTLEGGKMQTRLPRKAARPPRKSLQAGRHNGWQGYELMMDDGWVYFGGFLSFRL